MYIPDPNSDVQKLNELLMGCNRPVMGLARDIYLLSSLSSHL